MAERAKLIADSEMVMQDKSSGKLMAAGVLAAVAASLCCITPALAVLAGLGGTASVFSWLEPARPYLIGVTVLVLGFAWYGKLKPQSPDAKCKCEQDRKSSFWQSKTFLGIVTAFAVIMAAFPYYGQGFYPKPIPTVTGAPPGNIVQANVVIEGMDCAACNADVEEAISKLPGIVKVTADNKTSTARVKFDTSKTSLAQIDTVIDRTGYKVTDVEHRAIDEP